MPRVRLWVTGSDQGLFIGSWHNQPWLLERSVWLQRGEWGGGGRKGGREAWARVRVGGSRAGALGTDPGGRLSGLQRKQHGHHREGARQDAALRQEEEARMGSRLALPPTSPETLGKSQHLSGTQFLLL